MLYKVVLYDPSGEKALFAHNLNQDEAELQATVLNKIHGGKVFFLPQETTHLMADPNECLECYREMFASLNAVMAGKVGP